MKGLSLKGYKKIHEDKDWATLIHKDGHKIMIAKAPLSPIMRKQVEGLEMHQQSNYGGKVHLAEGGKASEEPSEEEGIMNDVAANAAPQTPPPQAAPVAQSIPAPQQMQSPGQAQNTGLTQEQAANLQLAQAQGAQGTAESKNYGTAASNIETLPTTNALVQNYAKPDADLAAAYAARTVDPSKYWTGDPVSGTEGHSKLLAGIGVLLSGAGQAIGSGTVGNGALDAIQHGIDREVDRQKNAQGQAMNLWQMNRQAYGNEAAANLATQNQLATGTQYTIAKTAAQYKTPIALAQANIANAKIQQLKDINNYKLALMNPSSDQPDPATRVSVLVPPDRQAAVTKEIAEAQNMVHNFPGIEEAFHQAAQDVRPLSGGIHTSGAAFIPGMKTPGQAAFQGRIAPTVQEAEGTVRKQAFDNIDANMTPAFGDSDQTIATKHQTLLDYAKSKTAAPNAKSFGIDLAKFPSTNTLGLGGQRPIHPQTKTIEGKKYIRGA